MEPVDLLRILASVLERVKIPYLVVGSTASITFGEPRYTNDIDVVVDLPIAKVAALQAAFPADAFYLSADAALDAIRGKGQFNIIHPESGLKVDLIVASESEFDRSQLARGVRVKLLSDLTVTFASPEDVIVKKMEYFREGGSEKHLRDIAGVMRIRGAQLDRKYIADWAARLNLTTIWQQLVNRVDEK